MGALTIADRPVFEARITLPLVGVWSADLVCDGASALSGSQTLSIDNDRASFTGTPRRPGVFLDTSHLRLVGGAGGMNKDATPRYYDNPTIRMILESLLSDAGESVASDSDASVLNTTIAGWTVIKRPTLVQVRALLETAAPEGTIYRMQPDGTLLVAPVEFPDSSLTDFQVITEDLQAGRLEIASSFPDLLPGTTLDGRRISYVEHHVTEEKVRTVALYE